MALYGLGVEGAAQAPIPLTGVSVAPVITVTGGGRRTVQAVLMTNPTYLVHLVVSSSATSPGTTLADWVAAKVGRCLSHLGAVSVTGAATFYIHALVTDASGTVSAAGALDYIYQDQTEV